MPLAIEFGKKFSVIGFDIKEDRIQLLQKKIDPSKEINSNDFDNCDILFSSNIEDLKLASFFIIAVPTPIDEYNKPDLRPLLGATRTIASVIKKEIILFMNQPFIRAAQRKIVSRLLKKYPV